MRFSWPAPAGDAATARAAPAAQCTGSFVINFQGFPAGTIAGEQYASFGVHISGIANRDHPDAIVVFDSNAPPTHDPDLAVDVGNILLLAENVDDENGDGLVDDPDENNFGGSQIFRFDQPVSIGSFLFIDKDHGTPDRATAFDADGNVITTVPIPLAGSGSVQTINVDADNVSRLEITYRDSAGLTGIEVTCPAAAPAAPTPTVAAAVSTPAPAATTPAPAAVAPVAVAGQRPAPAAQLAGAAAEQPAAALPSGGGEPGQGSSLLAILGVMFAFSGTAVLAGSLFRRP